MSQSNTRTPLPILEIAILFSAFCILLVLLILGNSTPVYKITLENIDQVHEVFQIDTHEIEEPIVRVFLHKNSAVLFGTTYRKNYVWNLADSTERVFNVADSRQYVANITFVGQKPIGLVSHAQRSIFDMTDLNTGQILRQITLDNQQNWWITPEYSPDGQWFAYAVNSATLSIFDGTTNKIHVLLAPNGYQYTDQIKLSPNNKFLAAGIYTSTCNCVRVGVWDVSTGLQTNQFELEEYFNLRSLTFSIDNRLLIVSGGRTTETLESYLHIFKVGSGVNAAKWSAGGLSVEHLFISPDNHFVAAKGYGDIWIWDIQDLTAPPREILHLPNPDGNSVGYNEMAVNNDWTLMAASNKDGHILIFDIKTGKLIKTLTGHQNYISQILFSDDRRFIVSSSSDGTIRFWAVGDLKIKPFTKTDTIALPTVTASPTWTLQEVIGNATAFMETSMPSSATAAAN